MKEKRQKNYILLFAITAVVLILYGVIQVEQRVNEEMRGSVSDTVETVVVQQQKTMETILDDKIQNIVSVADTLPIIGEDQDKVIEYLESMRSRYVLETLLVANPSGAYITNAGSMGSIVEEEYFINAIAGHTTATQPYISPYTNNYIIAISTPVYEEGEIVGIVLGTYTAEYIEILLEASTSNLGEAILLDGEGNVLISTSKDIKNARDFQNIEITSGKAIEDILSDISARAKGEMYYEVNGKEYFAKYEPLDLNDWTLVFALSEETLADREEKIVESMILFASTIAALFLAYMIYLWYVREKHISEVEKAAYYDELTGLPNLIKLKMEMSKLLAENKESKFILVKMDIENFKAINEMFDFDLGNEVIKAIGKTGNHVKEPTFILARTGADEFMLFAGNGFLDNFGNTKMEYEKVFKKIAPELGNHKVVFRYGRYFLEPGETDVNEIVNKVDMAHSFAKTEKKEGVWDYDEKYKKQVLSLVEITNKMEEALENREFEAYLQPKFRVEDRKIIGAEALVRWVEPKGNVIFPNIFIPLFESNGFIVKLDMYMFESVCKTIRAWIDEGRKPYPISVNFSKINLLEEGFMKKIKGTLDKHNVPPEYIEIELTETTVVENQENIKVLVEELHNIGVRVSIDDFGSGHSSLGMMKNFNVDVLKIDRSFFLDNHDERGEIVIEGIIKLAHTLNMEIVAEGVEDDAQVEFLKSIDCESAQGYIFAKPMKIKEFEKKYFN